MDQLDDNTISRLQAMTCEGTRSLLPGALDVLFFDCTTLYFESFKEDELKQNGYSKDCQVNQTQVNQPQVLLALLVTREGLPVGYEVFPGATFEGHSLISVLQTMQARYDVRKMIFVADRGMLNEDNLSALDEAGAYYIVGAKLKQLPVALQTRVLDKSAYQAVGKGGSSAAELTHKKRRLIVSHCPKRADKDQHDRQKAVDRLIKKIGKSQNPKSLLNNYGYKKFLIIFLFIFLIIKGKNQPGHQPGQNCCRKPLGRLAWRHHQFARYAASGSAITLSRLMAGRGEFSHH